MTLLSKNGECLEEIKDAMEEMILLLDYGIDRNISFDVAVALKKGYYSFEKGGEYIGKGKIPSHLHVNYEIQRNSSRWTISVAKYILAKSNTEDNHKVRLYIYDICYDKDEENGKCWEGSMFGLFDGNGLNFYEDHWSSSLQSTIERLSLSPQYYAMNLSDVMNVEFPFRTDSFLYLIENVLGLFRLDGSIKQEKIESLRNQLRDVRLWDGEFLYEWSKFFHLIDAYYRHGQEVFDILINSGYELLISEYFNGDSYIDYNAKLEEVCKTKKATNLSSDKEEILSKYKWAHSRSLIEFLEVYSKHLSDEQFFMLLEESNAIDDHKTAMNIFRTSVFNFIKLKK